jgi:hypothetical protein
MNRQYLVFHLISSLFFILPTTSLSQSILTDEDRLLFTECAQISITAHFHSFSFSENMLSLESKFIENKKWLVSKFIKGNCLDRRTTCIEVSLLLKNGAFHQAFNLIELCPNYLKDDINAFHLHYFTALVTLVQGNRNDAFKRLKAIHAQSKYKTNAERLLSHFFKSEEKED